MFGLTLENCDSGRSKVQVSHELKTWDRPATHGQLTRTRLDPLQRGLAF